MQIDKRTRVQNIREVWPKETDFSEWLMTDDGIEFLAQEIGIEIENPRRESRPGDYPCDIAANVLGDEDHIVVIENQYGKSNHDHLGKLLTYAAVHKAMTGIWIAETVSDDHRQVIDWLNDNSPPNVNLYLAELKLYRIGASPVAPQLDVVCRPNAAVKETKSGLGESDKERRAWRRRMWTEIHEAVRAVNPPFRLQKPGGEHWSAISLGRSAFSLNMLLTPKNQSIGIDLYVQPSWKEHAFAALEAQKAEIEAEIGAPLQWLPNPGKKAARILLEAKIDSRRPENEPAVRKWFAENTVLMYRVFRDRVLKLAGPEEGDDARSTRQPDEPDRTSEQTRSDA